MTALSVARTAPGGLFSHRRGPSAPRARVARDEPGGSEQLAAEPEVVAIGETGLDFNRDFSPRADQERAFEAISSSRRGWECPCFSTSVTPHERFFRDRLALACAASARRRPLLHWRWRFARRLPRPRPPHRGDRLDLRRAPRPAPARDHRPRPPRSPHDRDRCTVPTPPRSRSEAKDPAQRAHAFCPTSCGRWPARRARAGGSGAFHRRDRAPLLRASEPGLMRVLDFAGQPLADESASRNHSSLEHAFMLHRRHALMKHPSRCCPTVPDRRGERSFAVRGMRCQRLSGPIRGTDQNPATQSLQITHGCTLCHGQHSCGTGQAAQRDRYDECLYSRVTGPRFGMQPRKILACFRKTDRGHAPPRNR